MRDPGNSKIQKLIFEDDIDDHILTSIETPLRNDAFKIDDDLKVELIEGKFKDIMEILGLDLTDESLKDTPRRVAKMYVNEIFKGLNPENKPDPTLFENKFRYEEMLVEKNIIRKVKTERDIMRYDSVREKHHHLYERGTGEITDYFDDDLDSLLSDYFSRKDIPGFRIEEVRLQISGKRAEKK